MSRKFKGPGSALAVAALALSLPTVATADQFVCHVMLDDASRDLVFVEADSRMQAAGMAGNATVRRAADKRVPVKVVQECILRFTEKFADPDAAKLLERMPL